MDMAKKGRLIRCPALSRRRFRAMEGAAELMGVPQRTKKEVHGVDLAEREVHVEGGGPRGTQPHQRPS